MTIVFWIVALLVTGLLALVTFVQLLYLESLRLLKRELPALDYFRDSIQQRIGLDTERGALTFSLIKHLALPLLGTLFYAAAARETASKPQVFAEAALFSILAMLFATYIIPQALYRRTEAKWALKLLPLIRLLALLVRPLVLLLNFFESLIDLGQSSQGEQNTTHPSEHIEALITAGAEEGILEEEDRKLIHSVVAFGDKTVREVMTARPNIVAIAADKSLEDLRQLVIHEQFSRIPIFEESIDRMIGFIHVRDMFELDPEDRQVKRVREMARPIRLIPETKPVKDLLREMQKDGAHMAVVIDEYGNTAGLATMEDLVEEILGEIHDEHEPSRDVVQESDSTFVAPGSLDLDRLHDLLGFRHEEDTESTTIGGLVAEWLGHVPQVGEIAERDGIKIEVLAGNELRVERVRVSRLENATPA